MALFVKIIVLNMVVQLKYVNDVYKNVFQRFAKENYEKTLYEEHFLRILKIKIRF